MDFRTGICVPISYTEAQQLINQPETKWTILRAKAVYAVGFSLNSATGNKQLTDLGLQKHIEEATLGCFLQFCQTLAFLGHPREFSPAVTASVDDDKQQNDRYKDTSQEMLSIALDIIFILPALILFLKSHIISLRCRAENPFNTVEQIQKLEEYRSLSSFWL